MKPELYSNFERQISFIQNRYFHFSYNFKNQAIKLSYNRLNQYIHLISNTNAPAPLDIWAPSGPYLKPQQLDQLAFGFHSKLKNGNKLETEVFYKKIKN